MSLRSALIAAIVLGLGGLGIVGWIGMRLPPKPTVAAEVAPPPPVRIQVLAAAHPLRAGSLIKYDDIQPKEMLASEAPAGARIDTPPARAELAGSMVRRSLQPQDVLLSADLLRPGDHGFLAAVLRTGMRATTVGVDAVSGTAGLIWPGDHVDVLLTHQMDDPARPAGRRIAAETVLNDVRVIAIDQQLVQGAAPGAPEAKPATTVTLEVSSLDSERVSVANRLGKLSLVVRSAKPAEPGSANADPPQGTTTWAGDVSPALGSENQKPAPTVIHIFRGAGDGQEYKF